MKLYSLLCTIPVALVLLMVSCTEDVLISNGGALQPAPEGKVLLELYTNASDYVAPVTRTGSADENTVEEVPWVFVYRGFDDNAVFYEAVQAVIIGDKSYAQLTKTDQPSVLIVIANPPVEFFNGSGMVPFNEYYVTQYLSSRPRLGDAFSQGMLTRELTSPIQTTVPYTSLSAPHPRIPMSGRYMVPDITSETTIGTNANKLLLQRIVAKVDVEADPTIAGFTLLSATLVNVPRQGRLYQPEVPLDDFFATLRTDYLTSASGDGVTGIAPAVNGTTAASPLYVYESRKEDNATILVKGEYRGEFYYYRLAFYENDQTIDILRNKYYRFTITDVLGPGYTTEAEASVNPPSNIFYTITVTDQLSVDVVDNGQFYIGVTNSEFVAYAYSTWEGGTTLTAVTITTSANLSMPIMTNSITITTWSGPEITVSPAQVTLATTPGGTATTQVTIPAATGWGGTSVATITIRLGNLVKTIEVTRTYPLNSHKGSVLLASNVVSAKITQQDQVPDDWFSISTETGAAIPGPQRLILPTPMPLYITYRNNLDSPYPVRNGEIYANLGNERGTVKFIVAQQAAASIID